MADADDETRLDIDSAAVRRFAPGAIIRGRYRLGREIGRGGMGVVYRATDLELEREVAIKIVAETAATDDSRHRLLREARTAATLNHPHIVTVHDVGEIDGCPFFVMELLEGPTLAEARLSDLAQIVDVAAQLCDALEYAHARGLVHRDLKPDNVLLVGNRSAVKLADLGLAVPARGSRLTQARFIVGTAAYMAPEQAMGEPVDARADLYSLGVLLYELAVGRTPFAGDNPLAVISQHVHAAVVPPRAIQPDVPAALETIILTLLAKDPDQRYARATDVRTALRSALVPAAPTEQPSTAVAVLDALARGRLVGRGAELEATREFWRRARVGHSHGVLLSGEPGAGKTRLAREVIIQAALDGGVVLSGACYEYDAATPYLPFAEAFRSWVRRVSDDDELRTVCGDLAPLLARLAPDIATRLGPFAERPPLAPHEERLLFVDAVGHAFRQLAARHGLLFYIDDLHWADHSTLWLVGHLLRHLRDERVLLLASYRETELDRTHPLARALVDWNRERLITRVVLRRLSAAETREQLGALLGQPADDDFAAAVHRETEGNPFFVEEMLKALIEQGSVRREGGGWRCSAVGDLHIPESLRAAIGRRLDRVSAATNEVLRAAAVLGKTFDLGALQAAAQDRAEDALLDALDEAVAAQLLVAAGDGSFAFTHDKIRETLYEELNPLRRRRLHLRTAEGLERHRGRDAVAAATLAHHFMAGGDYERALGYARDAAVEAERLFAYEEAIADYRRALECAEALGRTEEQAAFEEAIGKVLVTAGDLIAAVDHFERALAFVRGSADRARLHSEAASSLVALGDPRGLRYVDEALAVLDPATHPIETAHALVIQGRFHHLAGHHRRAVQQFERAAALVAPESGGRLTGLAAATVSHLYAYLAGAHQHLGLFADSDDWARRAIAFGIDHALPVSQAHGYEFLSENAVHTRQWRAGLDYVDREREIVRRIHSRERQAWTCLPAGVCAGGLGDTARAEAEFNDGLALTRITGDRRLDLLLAAHLAILLADLGRSDEAMELSAATLERADGFGLLFMRTEARRARAHVTFRRGEIGETVRLCAEILELTDGIDAKVSRLHAGALHIDALLATGAVEQAWERWRAYEALVAECQAPDFAREVVRLKARLSNATRT